MAKWLILLSVDAIAALSALGLWANETRSGEETDIANWYLPGVAAVLVALVLVGIAFTLARRGRS